MPLVLDCNELIITICQNERPRDTIILSNKSSQDEDHLRLEFDLEDTKSKEV